MTTNHNQLSSENFVNPVIVERPQAEAGFISRKLGSVMTASLIVVAGFSVNSTTDYDSVNRNPTLSQESYDFELVSLTTSDGTTPAESDTSTATTTPPAETAQPAPAEAPAETAPTAEPAPQTTSASPVVDYAPNYSGWDRFNTSPIITVKPPAPAPAPVVTVRPPAKPNVAPRTGFRYMSPDEFVNTWYKVQPQQGTVYGVKPSIYGNVQADARIRRIAEGRGYRMQPISKTGAINPAAAAAFNRMAQAARREANISLRIVSGQRTPDRQRQIFKQGVVSKFGRTPSSQDLISGRVDAAINRTLNQRSIPGYSKHHSGYTFDINKTDNSFAQTAAFRWLSANNYKNARRFNIIPSYPPGVTAKGGPAPEPWEYNFIANTALVK